MTAPIQRPTVALGGCMGTPAHDWRVSAWVDFALTPEPEPGDEHPETVRGRAASTFACARCLAQVDAAVLYVERESAAPAADATDGDPRAHVRSLEDLRDELAQALALSNEGERDDLVARVAAVEWALSDRTPRAPA